MTETILTQVLNILLTAIATWLAATIFLLFTGKSFAHYDTFTMAALGARTREARMTMK